jgi:hypothetical protein
MTEVELTGLCGRNPLGLFAALGALALIDRAGPAQIPKLRWKDSLDPCAVLSIDDPETFQQDLLSGLSLLRSGPVLTNDFTDVKLPAVNGKQESLREWVRSCENPLDLRLVRALVAEGAFDGNGVGKPTHLHFSAGQQQFLDIAREVVDATIGDAARLTEALFGPWRFDGDCKNFGWSAGSERVFALRGFNPSSEKRLGVPGADALGFVGLSQFPVWERRGGLRTTACEPNWKSSKLEWVLWSDALDLASIRALLALDVHQNMKTVGVLEVVTAPIRRTDQGGYGSFGAASAVGP